MAARFASDHREYKASITSYMYTFIYGPGESHYVGFQSGFLICNFKVKDNNYSDACFNDIKGT